jgi:ABC-type uncharacterized transport system auxiliary subunit
MSRRLALLAALAAGGCSLLPERPNVPVRRYALSPRRPDQVGARQGAPVLLLRRLRAVPGLQDVALRRLRADGAYDFVTYEEWLAPPGDLADAALRAWLQASGLFAAVVPSGSRADAGLVLELQLTQLEAAPVAREARAGLAGVLLREDRLASRVVATLEAAGTAPLLATATPPLLAAAMEAALGAAFGRLEAGLAPLAR